MTELESVRSQIKSGLFPAVELIHRAPTIDGNGFNPVALIRAVGGLLPLGKENALAALEAYERLAWAPVGGEQHDSLDDERVFLILRVLFMRNDGNSVMPPLRIGSPDVPPPEDPAAFPLFPLAVVEQIPFLLIDGYQLGGLPERASEHIRYCREHCRLRPAPLRPQAPPLDAVEALVQSEAWRALVPEGEARQRYARMLRQQATRALASLPELAENEDLNA